MTYASSSGGLPTLSLSISEDKLVLGYLFLVLPVLDMMNGYLVMSGSIAEGGLASPSQLGRLLATILLIVVCIKQKLSVVWVPLCLVLVAIEAWSAIQHQNPVGAAYGLIASYKLVYLVLVCVVLTHFASSKQSFRTFCRFLKINVTFIAGSLILSIVTGVGASTYGWGFGTKGFFASGNGLGVYLGISSLFLFAVKYHGLYSGVSTASLLMFAVATAVIGSKTAMIFSFVLLLLMMMQSRYRWIFVTLLALSFAVLVPFILDTFTLVFDIVIRRYQNSESFIMFIGSGRIEYVLDAFEVFSVQEGYLQRLLVGSGAFLSFQHPLTVATYDTLESDLFDVLFMYGAGGLLVYLAYGVLVGGMLMRFPIIFLAFLLLFLHSVVAGHVLFNGMSSVAMAYFFATAMHLRSRGMTRGVISTH